MAHVFGHADFFKNNLWFGKTNRRMIDAMANHATRVRQHVDRHGVEAVEDFIDACLSAREPDRPARGLHRAAGAPGPAPARPPRRRRSRPRCRGSRARTTWSRTSTRPAALDAASGAGKRSARRSAARSRSPAARRAAVPARPRAAAAVGARRARDRARGGATTSRPQGMTKVMNEGWAALLAQHDHDAARARATPRWSTSPTSTRARWPCSPAGSTPTRSASSCSARSRTAGTRAGSASEYDDCDDLRARREWDRKLGLGRAEDLRGAEGLQRRHVHRRVPRRGVLRAPQALHVRIRPA